MEHKGIPTQWVVITGPPASGKSTLLNRLAGAGFAVSPDSTRAMIAEVAASGRDPEEFRFADDFQPKTLNAMEAAEDALDPNELTFLEYALPCNIAFHRTESRELTPGLAGAAQRYRYRHVFILDPLRWQRDAERVEDAQYQLAVHEHMGAVYRELGYDPMAVAANTPKDRFEFVLRTLGIDPGSDTDAPVSDP